MNKLSYGDYLVFLIYFLIVASYGYFVYRRKKNTNATASHNYFLAEGSLSWWAIGASLIASNISAEQFIGMSGSGFKIGLAISTYEWMAALTLIIVAVFFIPVYLKNKIYTMPQFLNQRYNGTVAMIMAVFWLLLYVVVKPYVHLISWRIGGEQHIRNWLLVLHDRPCNFCSHHCIRRHESDWLY